MRRLLRDIRFIPYEPCLDKAYKELALSWILENDFFHAKDTDFINRVEETIRSGQGMVEMAKTEDRMTGAYYAALDGDTAQIKIFAVHGASLHQDLEKAMLTRLVDALEKKESGRPASG